jgi:Sigma-70 region 2
VKSPIDEKALLEGLAVSDKKAVEVIYKENYNMVQALIINNNGSADDAKDIFQEAMIVLYEKAKSGTFELNCQIKTFVYSVSRRLWLKRLQQQNRFSSPGDNMEAVVPCKSLIEAYYLQKQNMQDIAARFGYTNADNAKNQKYKCLMRLKKIFFTHYKNGSGDE